MLLSTGRTGGVLAVQPPRDDELIPIAGDPWGYKRWSTLDYMCADRWTIPLPQFLDAADEFKWFNDSDARRPYLPCPVDLAARTCTYKGGCSVYQVIFNSSVDENDLGSCGNHEYLHTTRRSESDSELCDPRTLVPLRVPQGGYFGHFLDNTMARLVRVLRKEPKPLNNLVVYLPKDFKSPGTTRLVEALNFTLVHELPTRCFERVVWACHSLYFDSFTAKVTGETVREPFRASKPPRDWSVVPASSPARLAGESGQCWRRIYAARATNVRNGRRVPNEDEVARLLQKKYDFEIFLGNETLDEWAHAMSDACVLAGSHGGALIHLFWMEPKNKPKVIELDGFRKLGIFWVEAAALGYEYFWQSFSSETGVDLARLESLLAKAGITPRDETPGKRRLSDAAFGELSPKALQAADAARQGAYLKWLNGRGDGTFRGLRRRGGPMWPGRNDTNGSAIDFSPRRTRGLSAPTLFRP